MNRSLDLGMMTTTGFQSSLDKAPIMQFYFYRIDRKSNRRKVVKGTCLVISQRKTGTPQRLGPGSP
jgi:hypothetical protein